MIRASFALVLGSALMAQSSNPPQTYSFSGTSSIMWPEMTVKVNRNGAKELVEEIRAAKPGGAGAYHARLLYDFQAHRVYTLDLDSNLCTAQEYSSAYAPMFDPIGGSEQMAAGLAGQPPKVLARETVNGIPTKVVELALPEGQGKYKLWLDEKYSFPVKWVVAMASQPATTQLEIRQLRYEPSPTSLFIPPQGCTRIGGVSSADGGHAEVDVEAKVEAEATFDAKGPPQTQARGQASSSVVGTQPHAPAAPRRWGRPSRGPE